ncbi:MAG: DMT family transporter [Chloroflexota bacterium]|nr:DMT family transporter [Chloroflexota bacterium]
MTAFALALVLASAVAHATWNLFAKRSGGGVPFLWLALTLSIPLYAPIAVAVVLLSGAHIGPVEVAWMGVNGALNVAYFIFLQRGYRAGDLSIVYPLARGTGPVLATIGAIVIFGERPTPLAIAGAVSIAVGVFVLTGDPRKLRKRGVGAAVTYALLTGVTIATYTLWDKRGVSVLLIPPVLYEWGSNVARCLILTPFAVPRWAEVRREWATNRTAALVVASLSPLAYMLVLTALAISPVSYVAPAREIGILLGVFIGARTLAETDVGRRSVAAALMVGGVIALALG